MGNYTSRPIWLKRITGSKPLSAIVIITAVIIADMLLHSFLPFDFLEIDTRDFLQKYFDKEALSLSQWCTLFWNWNIRLLVKDLFQIVIIICLLFRFRFTKAENFQISRHTAVIAALSFLTSALALLYLFRYDVLNDGRMWQARIVDVFRTIFVVSLLEELVYRGFISNVLFRLKPNGLKTSVAIAISGAVFGFVHIQGGITRVFMGFPPSFSWGTAETFFSTAVFGVSSALILYHRKDLIALICIHAAHNILFESYRSSGESMLMGALYVSFYCILLICYPVILCFKARKQSEALRSG